MSKIRINLNDYDEGTYSQFGEDGILQKLFECVGVQKGYFCEFGAWDGKKGSNTYQFYKKGWSGCCIERDTKRYHALCRNLADNRVTKVCGAVEIDGGNSLDNILDSADAPRNIDLLSIDIDGRDLLIWKSFLSRRASCVVIEINPSIPLHVEYEERAYVGEVGNAPLSVLRYAHAQGYALVGYTLMNLIFLDRRLLERSDIQELEYHSSLQYFFGFDGSLLRYKDGKITRPEFNRLPWGMNVFLQPLPKCIRGFDRKKRLKKAYSLYSCIVLQPLKFFAFLQFFSRTRLPWKDDGTPSLSS